MGFYAPAQIVRDAREHGVEVRPGLRQRLALGLHAGADRRGRTASPCGSACAWCKGLANAACRGHRRRAGRPSPSRRSTISGAAPACRSAALVRLAEADAFRPALGLARREALWAIKALRDEPLPLFAAASAREAEPVPEVDEPAVALPADDRRRRGGRGLRPCRPDAAPAIRSPSCARIWRRARIVTCAEAMAGARWPLARGGRPRAGAPAARLAPRA